MGTAALPLRVFPISEQMSNHKGAMPFLAALCLRFSLIKSGGDFTGGPTDRASPSNTWGADSIPTWRANISQGLWTETQNKTEEIL